MIMRWLRSAAIIGASGFTGAELLRLLAGHPELDVVVATADTQAGRRAAACPRRSPPPTQRSQLTPFDLAAVEGVDVVFLGLPHQASMALAPQLVGRVGCVVDLSAAFRLQDASLYPQWYGFEHDQPELLAEAVYGLPERHRADLKGARLVATPGCYVTAATLALAPLLDAGLVAPPGIIVDAASGVSGAGRAATATNAFCTVDEDFVAYGLLDHRHTPEIEQNLSAQVLFTPHLAPMNRGILATCYARPTADLSTDVLLAGCAGRYADEPFVVVIDGSPSTKATLGSNAAHVTARYDAAHRHGDGALRARQPDQGRVRRCLQSANVALGLDETLGLPLVGVA